MILLTILDSLQGLVNLNARINYLAKITPGQPMAQQIARIGQRFWISLNHRWSPLLIKNRNDEISSQHFPGNIFNYSLQKFGSLEKGRSNFIFKFLSKKFKLLLISVAKPLQLYNLQDYH